MWLRDLAQLLRGRLGPRKAAAPEWWLLLACTTLLGAFGGHRFLLRRRKSAWLFVMLTVLGGVLAIDAITGTSWSLVVASFDRGQAAAAAVRAKTRSVQGYAVPPPMPPSPVQTALESEEDDGGIGLRELGVRASEGLIGCSALLVMLVALGRDLNWLLHGKLVHQRESELYYNTIIAWVLGGIFGAHRWVASKSSWRIFIVLDVYAVVLLCVAEIYFKENLGDPTTDPSRFSVHRSTQRCSQALWPPPSRCGSPTRPPYCAAACRTARSRPSSGPRSSGGSRPPDCSASLLAVWAPLTGSCTRRSRPLESCVGSQRDNSPSRGTPTSPM